MTANAKNVLRDKIIPYIILGVFFLIFVTVIFVYNNQIKADCTIKVMGQEHPGKFTNLSFVGYDMQKICCCSTDTSQTMSCECTLI